MEELDQVISAHDLRSQLHGQDLEAIDDRLTSHYTAAEELRRHHESSIDKLSALLADVGLLQVPLPSTPLSASELEYLKLLVMARGVKATLWNKISRYHDEINPLRESRRKGGKALLGASGKEASKHTNKVSIAGTKKSEKIKKSVERRGNAITTLIESYNRIVDQIGDQQRPRWIQESVLPKAISKRTVLSNDMDESLWSEVALGDAWLHVWQNEADRTTAPPWTYDAGVRLGMKHSLILDRIKEERLRLEQEVHNADSWLHAAVLAAWDAWSLAQGNRKFLAAEVLDVLLTARFRIAIRESPSYSPFQSSRPPSGPTSGDRRAEHSALAAASQ